MMFHVKPARKTLAVFGIAMLLVNCMGARMTTQIPDYLLVSGGKEILGGKPLTAFLFENDVRAKMQFESFVAFKYHTGNTYALESFITISGERCKLMIYDTSDFEKYFNSANYSPMHEETQNDLNSTRKFMAISIIDSYNQDCLAEGALLQHAAIEYLRNLKNEYLNQ